MSDTDTNLATICNMSKNPQQRWQDKMKEQGKCACCGKPKDEFTSRWYCKNCMVRKRRIQRQGAGSQPWKPGGRGRPPIESSIKHLRAKISKLKLELLSCIKKIPNKERSENEDDLLSSIATQTKGKKKNGP